MPQETTFKGLLEDLEAYLEYQRDEGVVRMEVDRATIEELIKDHSPEKAEELTVNKSDIPDQFSSLASLNAFIASCTNCPLCETRTNTVPGEGNDRSPDILFISDGPGQEENDAGRPFVGKPGQLFAKILEAMGYARNDVFITDIVKCSPPNTRKPVREEMDHCLPYLKQQIKMIQPKIIVALGATAMESLRGKPGGFSRMRGQWTEFEGIKVMTTFHPAYLLRDPSKKKEAWADLKQVLTALGKTPPTKK